MQPDVVSWVLSGGEIARHEVQPSAGGYTVLDEYTFKFGSVGVRDSLQESLEGIVARLVVMRRQVGELR